PPATPFRQQAPSLATPTDQTPANGDGGGHRVHLLPPHGSPPHVGKCGASGGVAPPNLPAARGVDSARCPHLQARPRQRADARLALQGLGIDSDDMVTVPRLGWYRE